MVSPYTLNGLFLILYKSDVSQREQVREIRLAQVPTCQCDSGNPIRSEVMKCILLFVLIAVGQYAEVTCFVPSNYRDILALHKSIKEVDETVHGRTMTVHIEIHPFISKIFNNTIVPIKKKVGEGYEHVAQLISNFKEDIFHTLGIKIKNETNPLTSDNITLNYEIQTNETLGRIIIKLETTEKQESVNNSAASSLENESDNSDASNKEMSIGEIIACG